MAEIPYSIRDKSSSINRIRGLNWDDISSGDLIKKVDESNAGDTNITTTNTSTQNTLNMLVGTQRQTVGVLDAEVAGGTTALHINSIGNRVRGMTIYDTGSASRVGIGITTPEEDLQINGNTRVGGDIQLNDNLNFRDDNSGETLAQMSAETSSNGGVLIFSTRETNGNISESMRILNNGNLALQSPHGVFSEFLNSATCSIGDAYLTDILLDGNLNFRDGNSSQNLAQMNGEAAGGNGGDLKFSTANSSGTLVERMRIHSEGHITQSQPYHLVFGLGDSGGGGIFQAAHNTDKVLNTLFVRTAESPTSSIYGSDLTSSTIWSPSIESVYQINVTSLFRSQNQDYLVESNLFLQKLISGTWTTVVSSNDRRYGSSINEADARAFTNNNVISQSFYALTTDQFRVVMRGRAFNGSNIWLLTNAPAFRMSITKLT